MDQSERHLAQLLLKIAAKDKTAFKELYELSSGKLYAVALRLVRVADHAEDILQDAFISIWRNAESYQVSLSPPMAWMGLITRSRALDFLRRRASERHLDGDLPIEDHFEVLQDEGSDPMRLSLASEQALALDHCLKKVDPAKRGLLVMAYFGDQTQKEIAASLRLPLGTVKSWIRRSLGQLRTCMSNFV